MGKARTGAVLSFHTALQDLYEPFTMAYAHLAVLCV